MNGNLLKYEIMLNEAWHIWKKENEMFYNMSMSVSMDICKEMHKRLKVLGLMSPA